MRLHRNKAGTINRATSAVAVSLMLWQPPAQALEAPAYKGRTTPLKIAENGKALLPVITSSKASPRVQAAAKTLVSYLNRITGADFKLETRPTPFAAKEPGIAVGVTTDFPDRSIPHENLDVTRTEEYLLRSHATYAWVIGASDLAVEHAVWDFLYRVGYRQFFPGEKWEVIPRSPSLTIAFNTMQRPDYFARRIWPGFGTSQSNYAEWNAWCARNRVATGIDLITGHSYTLIIRRNQKEFDAHPEYYALVKGKRQNWEGGKFCISNLGLRRLVIEDSIKQFDANPKLQSISLDPSDGGDWCECLDCLAMGSVTDRVVTLANESAAAVTAKYPDKFIGIYAYYEHSPPPTIRVHPRVVVSIATAFIRGGNTLDQLLDGWSKQASLFGIREYYSFYKWDWDMPGLARGNNTEYLKTTTAHFHERGARFMNSESSDNWGPNGLGYYLASRYLWNVTDAKKDKDFVDDFLTKAFGPAREPMALWYRLIDGANSPLLTQDLVGRLYSQLDKALKLTTDTTIRARLYDLALYTHYIEAAVAPATRKPSLEESMRYSWRMYPTHMIHTAAIWTVSAPSLPPEAAANLPNDKNPWKSNEAFTPTEIEKFVSDGIVNNPVTPFERVSYSRNLVPATKLNLKVESPGDFGFFRGKSEFYTWFEKAGGNISLQILSGLGTGGSAGDGSISLHHGPDASTDAITRGVFPRDNKQKVNVVLNSTKIGLLAVKLDDGAAGTRITWPAAAPLTFEISAKNLHSFQGKWSMYFYVPKGTKVVGGYRHGASGQVIGPTGDMKWDLSQGNTRDNWNIAVAPGEDGKLWKLQNAAGDIRLLSVPPYVARSAEELLLPAEVVKADGPK